MKSRDILRSLLGLIITSMVLIGISGAVLVPVVLADSPDVETRWIPTGSLSTNRYSHTATLLSSGKVLVVGGGGFPCSGNFCYSTVNGTAELYDPATETWTDAGSVSRRAGHSATLLPDGRVLIAGGANWGYDIGRFEYVNSAELYDPNTGKWRKTASPISITGNNLTAVLPNGKVLMVGSANPNRNPVLYSAEVYDPVTEAWNATAAPTVFGSLTLLSDGRVLVAGGMDGDGDIGTIFLDSAELYGPIAIPRIIGVSVEGKKLTVVGENFDRLAVILLNGEEQKLRMPIRIRRLL